jgi:hypothetical protein
MGSGLSLSVIQVIEIVKRDLDIAYKKIIANRGVCNSQYSICKSYMEDEQYYIKLRAINDSLEKIQSKQTKMIQYKHSS